MKKCSTNRLRTKAIVDGVIYEQPVYIDSCRDCAWFDRFSGQCVCNEVRPRDTEELIIPGWCPLPDVVISDTSNTIGVIGVIGLSFMFFVIGVITVLLVQQVIA